jgi:GTP cyclohydrolase I
VCVRVCRDLLLEVNGEDVSRMSLREIPTRIEQAARPLTLKLERVVVQVQFLEVLRDPRKVR